MQFNMHSKFPYGFNFRFPGHYRGSFAEWSVGIQNQLVLTWRKAVQDGSYTGTTVQKGPRPVTPLGIILSCLRLRNIYMHSQNYGYNQCLSQKGIRNQNCYYQFILLTMKAHFLKALSSQYLF